MGDSEKSKIEGEVELKSPSEKVFGVLSYEQHHIPNASTHDNHNIHHVSVHEGAWDSSGSIKLWKYTIDGVIEEFKEKIEVNEETNTLSMTAVEGHVLDQYKSYKIIFTVIPKSEACLVKITIEYEKLNDNDPPPIKYLNFATQVVKDIDQHLLKP